MRVNFLKVYLGDSREAYHTLRTDKSYRKRKMDRQINRERNRKGGEEIVIIIQNYRKVTCQTRDVLILYAAVPLYG